MLSEEGLKRTVWAALGEPTFFFFLRTNFWGQYKCGETYQEAVTVDQEEINKYGMIKFVIYSESRVSRIYLSFMRVTNELRALKFCF